MNTNDIKFSIIGILTAVLAPIIYQYYGYIKLATIGLGALTIGLIAVGLISGVGYGVAVAWLRVQAKRAEVDLVNADVAYRRAESLALAQKATVINAGQQLILSHADYPMQLIAHAAPHAPLALAERSEMPQLSAPVEVIDVDIMAGIRTGHKWIEEFIFDENGKLKSPHFSFNGPTRVGKTRWVLHLISLIQQPHPKAEYWLLDPKFEGESSGWPFQPFVDDFEEMADGLSYIYDNVVTKRKHDKRLNIEPSRPAFVIVDEIDGSTDEHGDKFVKPLRRGIKEGGSGDVHYFIIGQSSLIKENGLSGAIFRNTTRFIMGNEALAFTRNGQFTFWEKSARDVIAKQLIWLQENGKRAVLVIPMDGQGLPFVGEIPELPKPSFSQAAKVEEASKLLLDITTMTVSEVKPPKSGLTNEQESAICEMYADGYTLGQITGAVLGNKGGKQDLKVLNVLAAHGVELLPDHADKLAKVRG